MSNDTPEKVEVVSLRETFELEHLVEHYGAHFWRPRLREGEVRVGYICTEGDADPPKQDDLKRLSSPPIVVRTANNLVPEGTLFRRALRWKRLFPPIGSQPATGDLCVYGAEPPDDYAALSHVAVPYNPKKRNNPDPHFRCVHKALLSYSELASEPIWKDNESTWNVKGTAFFRWGRKESFPNHIKPHALTAGTLLSRLRPESVKITPSDTVELEPIQFATGHYNNRVDQKYTATFMGSLITSTAVTGTWQHTDLTEINNKLEVGLEVTKQFGGDAFAKFIVKSSFKWETAITTTVTASIGGGTTKLESVTLTQSCVVDIPAGKYVEVKAYFYRGRYDLSYEGILRLQSETQDASFIEVPIAGKFGVVCDTLQTWWDVGEGIFVTKTQPETKK